MSGIFFDTTKITLDANGRVELCDEDLIELEKSHELALGGGQDDGSNTFCGGSNDFCSNSWCGSTTNTTSCSNGASCNGSSNLQYCR
jgi:hypothetical protein